MATPSADDAEFLIGYCSVCAKQVLTHIQLGDDDAEVRLCLHCDTVIADGLESVPGDDLEAHGYALLEARTCGNGGGCGVGGGCGGRERREP